MRTVVVLVCVASLFLSCIPTVQLVCANCAADASQPELTVPGQAIPPYIDLSRANGRYRRLLNDIKARSTVERAGFGCALSVRDFVGRILFGPAPTTLQSNHLRLQV